jgi:hypothetical protein
MRQRRARATRCLGAPTSCRVFASIQHPLPRGIARPFRSTDGVGARQQHHSRRHREAQKRAYVLADNQIALQAGWSEELLAEELAWLRNESFDLDLIGFDATELERLLALADGEAASDEAEDEVPEPPEEPVSKPGDVWVLGNHRLLCGDATVLADVERVLGGHVLHRQSVQRRLRQLAQGQAPGQASAHFE